MNKYKISFTFDEDNSLNDIIIKVLLREIKDLNIPSNSVLLSCRDTSLNEGGINYKFREY